MQFFILIICIAVPLFASHTERDTIAPKVTGPIGGPLPIISPVAIAGSGNTFIAAWQDVSHGLNSSTSNDRGNSWSHPTHIGPDSIYAPSLSANPQGCVAAWVGIDIGYSLGIAMAGFSSDEGKSWSEPQRISPSFGTFGGNVNYPVIVSSSRYGFMAVWSSEEGYRNIPFGSYSSDGIHWSAPFCIAPNASLSYAPMSTAGVGNTWIATWQSSEGQGFAAISEDLGATWSAPTLLAEEMENQVPLSIAATPFGFLVAWKTSEGTAFSCFASSLNPTNWNPPVLISAGLYPDAIGISLGGFGKEFIASWQTSSNSCLVSISTNLGATWSTPALLVDEGTLHKGYNNLVGITLLPSGGIFVWLNDKGKAMAGFTPLPNLPSNTDNPPFGPNNGQSGKGVFH